MPGERSAEEQAREVLVEQRDRAAAAELIDWQQKCTDEWEGAWRFFHPGFAEGARRGVWDEHPVVQTFARHRNAARNAALDEAAKVAADGLGLTHTALVNRILALKREQGDG